jgi:DNA recombination protein RmuC
LKAVHYGWRQEQLTENAKVISELGTQLYERVRSLTGHFLQMRKGIELTADSYNKAIGTLERQVLSTTRKFDKLGAGKGDTIPEIEEINSPLRSLQAPELREILAEAPLPEDDQE